METEHLVSHSGNLSGKGRGRKETWRLRKEGQVLKEGGERGGVRA